jgi:hypothetical protein
MGKTLLVVCASTILTGAVQNLFAADPTVDTATRSLLLQGTPNGPKSDSSSATSGVYNQSLTDGALGQDPRPDGTVSQNTDIQPLIFGGDGHAEVHGTPNDAASGDSQFNIQFTTTQSYTYFLGGSLSKSVDGGFAFALATLNGPGVALNFSTLSSSPVDLTSTGTMGPGTYTFLLEANAGFDSVDFASNLPPGPVLGTFYDDNADFTNATLTLRPLGTPEPASLAILGMSASVLLLRRRRDI